ncbi:hypothetical protein SAMD00019534_025810 [Acytostelium subglobosum LB1]|uniref:hypothetical protein n=1 Tax=Acytostelium subglobosum LB1 TaxID=1410327 RepID=UPI0006447C75|nr:hypothetical protein SAMD00019534_025810 [Acytostelium subglobosum LB1]GAM19406.1 hypothetical protein SAMD00019534_025810 [Acytostelium subglobosum LB1]|eukprot:XP_012757333.1 hypothetical protein SAMD00019534_025810 [Acytostelium subglobosum LB1]
MSLVDMLRFNATQMFIKAFDSVASDYPVDNITLLTLAIDYNNATVFNHLINRQLIRIKLDWRLFLHGNIDLLRSYLAATGHRGLPNHMVANLPFAVDSGNVERGVRVEMLRVLHELHCLFELVGIWEPALQRSAKSNMMDSVQYILDNKPPPLSLSHTLLGVCLQQCAKHGNVDMFQAFIRTSDGNEYLNNRDITPIIRKAATRGQQSFIKYLLKHHVGKDHITKDCETQIHILCQMPTTTGISIHMAMGSFDMVQLHSEQLAGYIRNDDIEAVDVLLSSSDITVNLTLKMCQMMSKSMATLIFSRQRTNKLRFGSKTLGNIVSAGALPGSNITVKLILDTIDTRLYVEDNLRHVMESASCYSAALMQRLHSIHSVDYHNSDCLAKALENRCHEAMSLIFKRQCIGEKIFYDHREARTQAFCIVSKAPLSEVTFILEHMSNIRRNVEVCAWAASNPHPDVLEHVIGLFTGEQLSDGELVARILNEALTSNSIENVRILQRHFEQPQLHQTEPLVKPKLSVLHSMARQNCYLTLEHYLSSTTFTSQPSLHQLRTLHSILNVGYEHSTHRVIKLCSDLIQSLTLNQSLTESTMNVPCNVHHATSLMETAFHSVFNDPKLGNMVMEQIGRVHKSLGIDSEYLIKGAQLIDKHCLMDYLKYGATEWFLKSFSPSNVVYDSPLLDEALVRCDTRAVDVLMANPKLELIHDLRYFVSQTEPFSTLDFNETVMSEIKHPSFLRKLIQSGFKPSAIDSAMNFAKIARSDDGWLTKPWAVEMLELLTQHELLSNKLHTQLLYKSIELKQSQILQFYIQSNQMPLSKLELEKGNMFITMCCTYGVEIDHLEAALKGLPFKQLARLWDQYINYAAENGHLAILQKILSYGSWCDRLASDKLFGLLPKVLQNGYLDVANFILSFPQSKISVAINSIHHSIISIDLIDRLLTHPNVNCRFNRVLGSAVEAGNKEVINKLLGPLPANSPIKTFYRYALQQAALVGDLDSIRRIMVIGGVKLSVDDLGALVDRVGQPNSLVTEDVIIELAKSNSVEPQVERFSTLLTKVASSSLALVKLVTEGLSKDMILTADVNAAIEACINRGDNESLEIMIQLSKTVCLKGRPTERRVFSAFKLESFNSSALNHLFDHGHISVDDAKSEALTELVDWACEEGKLDILHLPFRRR